MSKTVKGRVQAVSLKPKKDYYGICIDDNWYNGSGDLQQNVEEAEVELTVKENTGFFIDIEEINIIEEDSEDDAQSRGSEPVSQGEREKSDDRTKTSSNTPMSERQAAIQANSMTKTAAEIVAEHEDVSDGEYIDKVSTLANGLNQISSNIREENLENEN